VSGSWSYWEGVRAGGGVPTDRPLAELTVELTQMLGDPDPEVRYDTAVTTLLTWIAAGVYDDLLVGLGDGMASGLGIHLNAERRTASAQVLTGCLARAEERALLPDAGLLRWADALLAWFSREPGADAIEPGADALAQVARSSCLGAAEEVVLLETVVDRVLESERLDLADLDALVGVVLTILRLDLVAVEDVEPLLVRVGRAALADRGRERVAEGFLRSLYVQLALSRNPVGTRADLVLLLVDLLREINPTLGERPVR